MIEDTTEYVHDGQLVKKTGRKAVKRSSQQTTRRRSTTTTNACVVEIEPACGDIHWTKWVDEMDLYEIVNEGDTDNDER